MVDQSALLQEQAYYSPQSIIQLRSQQAMGRAYPIQVEQNAQDRNSQGREGVPRSFQSCIIQYSNVRLTHVYNSERYSPDPETVAALVLQLDQCALVSPDPPTATLLEWAKLGSSCGNWHMQNPSKCVAIMP